jgi:hypothetical protein
VTGVPYLRYSLLPPLVMPGEQTRTLWCLVDHDLAPFEVTVSDSVKIDLLKDAIKEKKVLHDVDASSLMLWQVRIFYRPA